MTLDDLYITKITCTAVSAMFLADPLEFSVNIGDEKYDSSQAKCLLEYNHSNSKIHKYNLYLYYKEFDKYFLCIDDSNPNASIGEDDQPMPLRKTKPIIIPLTEKETKDFLKNYWNIKEIDDIYPTRCRYSNDKVMTKWLYD